MSRSMEYKLWKIDRHQEKLLHSKICKRCKVPIKQRYDYCYPCYKELILKNI